MASMIGRIEVDLTIRKFRPKNKFSDPLHRAEGGSVKLRVYEENKYNFLTVEEAITRLNKLLQR